MIKIERKAHTPFEFALITSMVLILGGLLFVLHRRYDANAHVLETERLMQSVRQEQEALCKHENKYAVYTQQLQVFNEKPQGTLHVLYDLSSGKGMLASSKRYGYQLQMPSYADGRLCCDNCNGLDRAYPPCALLVERADFVQPDQKCTFYGDGVQEQPSAFPSRMTTAPALTTSLPKAVSPYARAGQIIEIAGLPNTEVVTTITSGKCGEPERGSFYIEPCEKFQAGTQGAVVFNWNRRKCKYEAEQSCSLSPSWQVTSAKTETHQGVYPSDVDTLCEQLLKEKSCGRGVTKGSECSDENKICVIGCKITEKTEVQETKSIVLDDVTVQLRRLKCMPAQPVTVPLE